MSDLASSKIFPQKLMGSLYDIIEHDREISKPPSDRNYEIEIFVALLEAYTNLSSSRTEDPTKLAYTELQGKYSVRELIWAFSQLVSQKVEERGKAFKRTKAYFDEELLPQLQKTMFSLIEQNTQLKKEAAIYEWSLKHRRTSSAVPVKRECTPTES